MTVDRVIAKIIWLTFFGPPCRHISKYCIGACGAYTVFGIRPIITGHCQMSIEVAWAVDLLCNKSTTNRSNGVGLVDMRECAARSTCVRCCEAVTTDDIRLKLSILLLWQRRMNDRRVVSLCVLYVESKAYDPSTIMDANGLVLQSS